MRSTFAVLLAFVTAAAGNADRQPPRPIRSDLHLLYEPLESEAARSLLDRAQALARIRLGEPVIPVREVHLRRSVPLSASPGAKRDFQLTEITDSTRGIFTIYLSARPEETAFAGQLAHEAFHLKNARLRDCYVEGLNCLLAEEFLAGQGLSFEPWQRHFRSGKEPLYGAAYFLAVELAAEVGRPALFGMFRFAVESAGDPVGMEIDIDAWLGSLGADARARARAVIARRHAALDAIRIREQPELAFRRPRAA